MMTRLRQWLQSTGVRLPANKQRSLRSRIMPVPLPAQLRIPVQAGQQIMVTKGDQITRNQLLVANEAAWGLRTHSPAAGTVTAIDHGPTLMAGSPGQTFLVIDVGDDDSAGAGLPALADYRQQQPEVILERLHQAGVHSGNQDQQSAAAMLHEGRSHQASTLIINAVESEPYVCADEALLREYADEIVSGSAILQYAGLAERCVIAVQRGKDEAIAALESALHNSDIELYLAPTRYPAGHPTQLVRVINGREIPSGSRSVAAGAMVLGLNAARAAYRAVQLGEMDVSHIVTLAGKSLRTPKNFAVPAGTAAAHLLALCGLEEEQQQQIVINNPLYGHVAGALQAPVDREHKALIAAGANEFAEAPPVDPCIHCGRCASVCPIGLQPQLLEAAAGRQDSVALNSLGLADCIECGACNIACPSNRPLLQTFQVARQERQLQLAQAQLSGHWQRRFQFHQYRMKKASDDNRQRRAEKTRVRETAQAESFSRDQARQEIADAVARVKARRAGNNREQS